jgi:hypothetical protein
MTPIELLRAARQKITSPENFTRGTWARDANGKSVPPSDPSATCWCAEGALIAVSGRKPPISGGTANPNPPELIEAGRRLTSVMGDSITRFSDTFRHLLVLRGFDECIETLELEQAAIS